jgi:hypothetical protein
MCCYVELNCDFLVYLLMVAIITRPFILFAFSFVDSPFQS